MTPLVVLILAVMWVLVLVPPLLRSRTDGRPSASVHSFKRQLSTLGRANPPKLARVPNVANGRPTGAYRPGTPPVRQYSAAPRGTYNPGYGYTQSRMSQRSAAKRRRQSVLLTMVGAVFLSGVLAYGMGMRAFMWVNLAAGAALLGYLYLLISMRKAEELRGYRSSYYEAA